MRHLLDGQAREEHRSRNVTHSALLLSGLGLILAVAAVIAWGWPGVIVAFAAVAILTFSAPRLPPEAIMGLYRAKRVPPGGGSQLTRMAEILAERAELPRAPDIYVVPSMTLNAFATGSRERSAIAVTEGLLRRLSMREIAGVLAHEISHVRNDDLWVMNIADVITRLVQALSYVGLALAALNVLGLLMGEDGFSWWLVLVLYLAPAASSLLQLGLSRAREYDADLEGAGLTGDPMGLASALSRLERYTGQMWEDLAFPVPGRRVPQPSILRSHPPTEERVARLRELVLQDKPPPIASADEPMVSLVGLGPGELRPRFRFPGVWY